MCPCSAGSPDIQLQLLCLACIWSQPSGDPWSTSGEVQSGYCALVWADAAPTCTRVGWAPLLQSWPSTFSSSFPPVPAEGSNNTKSKRWEEGFLQNVWFALVQSARGRPEQLPACTRCLLCCLECFSLLCVNTNLEPFFRVCQWL